MLHRLIFDEFTNNSKNCLCKARLTHSEKDPSPEEMAPKRELYAPVPMRVSKKEQRKIDAWRREMEAHCSKAIRTTIAEFQDAQHMHPATSMESFHTQFQSVLKNTLKAVRLLVKRLSVIGEMYKSDISEHPGKP
jgi:hypothetical protein